MRAGDLPSGDMFEAMMDMQAELQTHAHPLYLDPREMTDTEQKIRFIRDMREALEAELQEAIDETTWKPWSTKSPAINREAYKGEMVDAFHFFMNMMLVEDITVEELFAAYKEKHDRNKARWAAEGGYQADQKCPRCKRAWDDIRVHSGASEAERVGVDLADGTQVCLACVQPGIDQLREWSPR